MSGEVDWNARYAEGDTPWDKGSAHPVLSGSLTRGLLAGRILVPGCGTGHDARALAADGLDVTGLDISPLALEAAKSGPGNVEFVLGNLFELSPDFASAFDGVFEHTCFCAIDPARRADYVRAIASVLKPGGRLLAVFFLDPGNDGDGPPFGCTRDEIEALFRPFFRVVREESVIPTFAGREGRELLMLMERV
ncbi:MAG: methyltransferase domain-containing protein [Chthoniobacterales bacterium]